MNTSVAEQARTLFTETYGGQPDVLVMAPGRVNLIGEHTDYQNGYVCPMALEKYTAMAASFHPTPKGFSPMVRCTSKGFATGTFTITNTMQPLPRDDPSSWMNYLIGVVNEYQTVARSLSVSADINLTIVSDVPFGSGLSSSAALETAMAKLMEAVIRLQSENLGTWDPLPCKKNDVHVVTSALMKNLATSPPSSAPSSPSSPPSPSSPSSSTPHSPPPRVQQVLAALSTKMNAVATTLRCQNAEHVYGGVQCGIMDQYVSACATTNNAIMIDCSTLESFDVPMPPEVAIVVTKTNVQHSLGDSAYNDRVQECNDAVTVLNAHAAALKGSDDADGAKTYTTLRDVNTVEELHAAFQTSAHVLSSISYSAVVLRRAQHVVSENQRVVEFRQHMIDGNFELAGQCMYASHVSLQKEFEVSCPELDELVAIAQEIGVEQGVYGARMTGGGFGGCTVTMVRASIANQLRDRIENKYIALHPDKISTGGEATDGKRKRLSFVTRAGCGASILEPSRLSQGYYGVGSGDGSGGRDGVGNGKGAKKDQWVQRNARIVSASLVVGLGLLVLFWGKKQ